MGEYLKIFEPLKNGKLKILEVGIFRGGFLLWMEDYFKDAEITGIDINILPDIKKERIKMLLCDQNDSNELNRIGQTIGKFDIIIDDGSHRYEETKNTFKNLFPYLKDGGMYIIEDFVAGYWPQYPEYKNMHLLPLQIAEKKEELGISDFNIILKEPKCSLAIFKKKEKI
jgi:cephalosporin hydroxylase